MKKIRNCLPYGIWTCADGREVLFDRFYQPMFQRLEDGTVSRADSGEWVKWEKQNWFYHDGTPYQEKRKAGVAALAAWGLEPGVQRK